MRWVKTLVMEDEDKNPLVMLMEETIMELSKVYINGGRRGYLVDIAPQEVVRVLAPVMVKVGIEDT